MSHDTKNTNAVSTKGGSKIAPIYWFNYFLIAFAMGFFGGLCISIAASDRNFDFFYWIGYGFWIVATFFSIDLLKEVIAEAGVRAREVYYGKPRAIKQAAETESGWTWGE